MKRQQGITLIALVITIIVMLILVGVTITLVLNGGLIERAKEAANGMNSAKETENALDFDYNAIISGTSGSGQQGGATTITWTKTSEETLAVGSSVKHNATEEEFYVIGFKGTNNNTAILLAAKCVDTREEINSETNLNHNKQNDSYNTVAFDSSTNVYADASIKNLVDSYVTETLGLNANQGRLMSYTEATALQSGYTDILYGTTPKLHYWLGSTNGDAVWVVDGTDGIDGCGYGNPNIFGVRPVVEILVTSIG